MAKKSQDDSSKKVPKPQKYGSQSNLKVGLVGEPMLPPKSDAQRTAEEEYEQQKQQPSSGN